MEGAPDPRALSCFYTAPCDDAREIGWRRVDALAIDIAGG
jgi:hypothetical protein